jgi:hypothetical protein
MTYDETALPTPMAPNRDILEALWTLEDLHRQLIKQIHHYVRLQEGTVGQPVDVQRLAELL